MNQHASFAGPCLPANLPDLDDIEAGFNRSMALYEEAFNKIAEADEAINRAYAAIEEVTPGAEFHTSRDAEEVKEFHKAVQLPSRDLYMRVARKLLTLRCWHYVIDRCGLQQLMDSQAKQEFDQQLRYVPDRVDQRGQLITDKEAAKGAPPFTADNARATLARFAAQANMIWRRGIANAFSQLDRRFRSHDGFKVGSRVILTYFASVDCGRIDTHGRTADVFRDIERTFHILDGRDPRDARSDFLWQISNERGWGAKQSEHENEYLRVRVFKNGNAHLWFKRDDLVAKVNRELAAYYGEVIGDARTQEEDVLESRAVTHARHYGFFPTPPHIAKQVVKHLPWSDKPRRILEPSAGTGNLAYLAAEPRECRDGDNRKTVRDIVDAVEIQPDLATKLRESGRLNRVITGDFLRLAPEPLYDIVLMNPPFDRERDIDHVTQALKWLKPGGCLLAIMSAGVEFRETRKATAFRKLLDERKGWMIDMPPASFADVGTYVNTSLVGIGVRKPWRFGDY